MNSIPQTNQLARQSIQRQSRPIRIDCQKTLSTPLIERQSSRPIPIKIADHTNESDCDSVDSSHYDMLTWRMYNRIVNARRIRAFSRSNENLDEDYYLTEVNYCKFNKSRIHVNRDKDNNATEHMPEHEAATIGSDTYEKFRDDDQVFVLELTD